MDADSDESVIYVWPAIAVCSVPPTNKFPSVFKSPPIFTVPTKPAPPATNKAPVVVDVESVVSVIYVWPDIAVCCVPPTNKFPCVFKSFSRVRFPFIAAPPITKREPVSKDHDSSFFVIIVWPDIAVCCVPSTNKFPPIFTSNPIPTPPSTTNAPLVVLVLCVELSIEVIPWIKTSPCVCVVVNIAWSGNNVPTGPSCFPITSTKTVSTLTVKEPVLLPVACVLPILNLPSSSDQPINTLSPVVPLSITIPESFTDGPTKPVFNSINASLITVLSVFTVVVVPCTAKSPAITALPKTFISPPTFIFFIIPTPPATNKAPLSI